MDDRTRHDHYGALVRTIAGQQLSVKAARAIYGRLTARFEDRPPTPQEILDDEPEELRAAAGTVTREGELSADRWPSTRSQANWSWSGWTSSTTKR